VGGEDAVVGRLRAAGCVFAEEEAELLRSATTDAAELNRLVTERVGGRPLETLLGWAEFCGLRVGVVPGVFVPRRRTEFLVTEALRRSPPRPVVVDLCCGTGAIGLAVAAGRAEVELYAADVDPVAVGCARANLREVGMVFEGDLYAALPKTLRGRVDLLLVNAPYVPTDSIAFMPPEARSYEPAVALDGGPDGVDVHRRVAADAASWLAPGGRVLIETGRRQARLTADLVAAAGLRARIRVSDELEATVVVGTAGRRRRRLSVARLGRCPSPSPS
jgi:release factor glutamine methyltransferase